MKELFNKEIKFSHIFELPNIFFEKQTSIELEYRILKKTKKSTGIWIIHLKMVTPHYRLCRFRSLFCSSESSAIFYKFFQRDMEGDETIEFVEILKIFKEIREYWFIL
jgi:hypothetical protein